MSFLQRSQKLFTILALLFMLTVTTACGVASPPDQAALPPASERSAGSYSQGSYSQLERGNTSGGQSFGDWVVTTGKGLIQDAYVRDGNKLGVVISPQVRPNEVRPLAKSLVQGFRRSAPNRDLTVLVYAPDKQLILTAKYDTQSQKLDYQ